MTTDIIHLHDERLHYYRGNFAQFEEMYEQRRREVNKEFEKYQKQIKAAKKSGSKANADKVEKNARSKQKHKDKRAGGGGGNYEDEGKTAAAPRQWVRHGAGGEAGAVGRVRGELLDGARACAPCLYLSQPDAPYPPCCLYPLPERLHRAL